MKRIIFGIVISLLAQFVSANPILDGMRVEDQSRLCPAAEQSADTRLVRRDAAYVADTMGVATGSIKVLIADCGDVAVAAMTVNTIVISPSLATLTRGERLFLLAHEIGHLANNDAQRWSTLGDELVESHADTAAVDAKMSALSRELELGADAFAAQALRKMGLKPEDAAFAYFHRMHLLNLPGTASHPPAQYRVEAIAQLSQ